MSPIKPIDTAIFLTWRGDESQTTSAISPSNPGGDRLYEGSAIAANRRPAKGLALTTLGTHDPCGNLVQLLSDSCRALMVGCKKAPSIAAATDVTLIWSAS